MTAITTRAGKGSGLTNAELDANFTNLNNGKMEKTGGTFTGQVIFTNPGNAVVPSLDGPNGSYRYHNYLTSGVTRWASGVSTALENSNNTGSDWFLARYADNGAYLDTPFTINRATGAASFSLRPSFGSATPWDNGNLPNPAQTTGGIYSGNITVRSPAGISRFVVDGGTSQDRYYGWFQDSVPRWVMNCSGGANNFYMIRYDAQGNNLDYPLYVNYSTGEIVLSNLLRLENAAAKLRLAVGGFNGNAYGSVWQPSAAGTSWPMVFFNSAGSVVGSVSVTDAAAAFNAASDYRLKTDLRPIADPLASVNRMKFYDGEYKASPGKRVDFVLAHELQAELPFAVTGEKDAMADWRPIYREGYDSADVQPPDVIDVVQDIDPQAVDYSKLVPRLGAAIQQLSSQLDAALIRIAALESRS